jgi:hypothetical protein
MAIYRVQGPDGNIYKIEGPDGAKPHDIEAFAAQQYANRTQAAATPTEPEVKPDTGAFTGSAKAGLAGLKAGAHRVAGKLGLEDIGKAEEEAKKQEKYAEQIYKPTEEGWLEAPWTKLKETAGGSLPYTVAPVIAGAAVGAAPVAGALGLGATTAAMLGAGAASAAQFTGSNLSRQVQEGKSLQDASLMQAAAAAIPQAALDVVGLRYIPGIQKIFKSVGQDITEQAAKKMLEQGTLRTAGQYIAGGAKIAGIEGATEAGQQFFERLQAGLNIADPEARKEYLDNFIGGAALGAVASPFGVRGTRGQAKEVVAKAQAGRDAQALQEEENRKAQEAETLAAQKEMQGMAPSGLTEVETEQNRIRLERSAAQITDQRRVLENKLDELRTQASEETDLGKLQAISEEAQKYHTALDDIDPDKIKTQIASLAKDNTAIQKQLKKIKDDPEAAAELQTSLEQNQTKAQELTDRLAAIAHSNQKEVTAEKINSDLAKKQKALDKAKSEGDLLSVGKIVQSMKELQAQHPGEQPSLFEGEGEDTTYPDYQKRLAEEDRQRKAKSQEVLDQEAIENYQQQEIAQSIGEKPKLSKYKEEMTQDEYMDLLSQKLVDLHTRPDTHVPAPLTPAQKAAETKRVNAINAAKADFDAKSKEYQDLVAKADELGRGEKGRGTEIYTARGDVAALGKQVEAARKAANEAKAKMIAAIPDGTKTTIESGRASEAAQDVHLLDLTDTIDSMRKGEWFGGPNPEMATGSLATKTMKARKSLDKYIQATVSNINYARLAKGMDRLNEKEKADIVHTLDKLMTGKIQRATGKKAMNLIIADRLKSPIQENLNKINDQIATLRKNGQTIRTSPAMAELTKRSQAYKDEIANIDAAVTENKIDKLVNKGNLDTEVMRAALEKAGFRFTEQEVLTGFHRNEYKAVQQEATKLKNKYTNQGVKEVGKLQKIPPEGASRYAVQNVLAKKQAVKNAKEVKAAPQKTTQERTKETEQEAAQQTGLGLAGKKQTFETAEKLQAALPHQGPKVQAAFNFAKQYYKEMLARRSMIMNAKQREALKAARKKYIESRAALNQQFKNSRVDPRIAKIMNWMVTADEKTARYRKAENLIIGMEEKMQQQVFAKTPKKQVETIAPAKKEEQEKLTEKEQQLKEELGYTLDKEKVEEEVGRISEIGLAKMRKTMQDRVDFITKRLESQKAPVKDRESLVKEKDKLMAQIKATDQILNARRIGMIIGQAQEEKGARRYKATKTEKKMVKEGKLGEKGITPEAYDLVLKAFHENQKGASEADFNQKIRTLTSIELRLERAGKGYANVPPLTAKRKKQLEKQQALLRDELKPFNDKQTAEEEAEELGIKDVEAYKRMLNAMNIKFSRGTPQESQTVNEVVSTLEKAFGEEGVLGNQDLENMFEVSQLPKVSVLQSMDTAPKWIRDLYAAHVPADAKGFTDGDKAFLIADNLGKNEALGVLLHEVGTHIGFKNFFNKNQYNTLVNVVKKWGTLADNSIEAKVGRLAKERVEAAGTAEKDVNDELLAYAIEEAVKLGIDPYAMKGGRPITNWLRSLFDAFKKYLKQIGLSPETLTAGDLVNMAYGAAHLELHGTWHGSPVKFKKFDLTKAGTGEKEVTDRFTQERIGNGPYVTNSEEMAKTYYAKTLAMSKAAKKTLEYDGEKWDPEPQPEDAPAKKRAIQAMLTTYMASVRDGGVTDPAHNKAVKNFIEHYITNASSPQERELFKSLDPAKIKVEWGKNPAGHLYRTLDDVPKDKVYQVYGNQIRQGQNPKLDALVEKFGSPHGSKGPWDYDDGDGPYHPGNFLWFDLVKKFGDVKAGELLHEASFDAIERTDKNGHHERAYLGGYLPEIFGVDLNTVGTSGVRDRFDRVKEGELLFSRGPKYNSTFSDLGDDVNKIVHANKSVRDKVHAAAAGFKTPKDIIKDGGALSPKNILALRTRLIDRFAPMEKVAEALSKMQSSLEGTQLMYYLRMFDQGINWVAQTASHGPMSIIEKKRADGKVERIIETKEGASLLKVSQALKEADVGDANAANQLFTFYLAAKRAKNKGLSKLNFGENVTQEMLDKVMARIESDPKTAKAFANAADIYNEYNKGLINFGVQTGRFSKEEAAKLLKENDYVPFYRINKTTGEVWLDIGGADPVHIGNIKEQPYLKELAGDNKPILDVFTSALQNTRMLTDMALRNLATRNVAFSLQQLGGLQIKKARSGKDFGSGIYPTKGPASPDVIRFKIDGVDHHAIVDTDAMGIPAELLVKGMDGVSTSMPTLVKVAGYPAKWLRSFITRNPAYAIRQIARDSLSNAFTTGSNSLPIIDNLKQLGSMLKNTNEGEMLLKRRGVLGGQVLGNASDAMQKAMLQIIDGKPGWEKAMAYLDHVAMMGDASSRVTSYESFVKQGLSDMEATLAALEAMNFSKKGTSPSLYLLNHMVPFLNAQIQGMDVLYKAFAGKMPFADKLDIKSKIWKRGAMMAAFTMAYTAMSYDDDDYQNATAAERIGNWFIKVPGIDEKVKVPIPFEVGGIFKMFPEMIYSTAFKDKKLGDAASEISKYAVDNFMPSFTPTAIKPIIELGANYSFFTGKPIESQRLRELAPGERAYANTPEVLKALGRATNMSPVQMEYLIRTYTGSLPLALLSLANPVASEAEAPEGRGALSSTTPIIGAFFQPKDANGLIDKAYQEMNNVIQAERTFKNYVESGRDEEAEAFLTKEADLIGMASFSGKFRKQMGDLAKQERMVRSMTGISGAEKRQMLDEIKEAKIEISKAFTSARE